MATLKRQRKDGNWEYLQMTGEDVITLKNDVEAHLADKASLTKVGHVQLSSATNSDDETKAATSRAVQLAFKKAVQAEEKATYSMVTGVVSDGAIIPKTPGYKNYIYFLSMNSGSVTASSYGATSIVVDVGHLCSIDQSTRVVNCKIAAGASYQGNSFVWVSATANFLEIAWN